MLTLNVGTVISGVVVLTLMLLLCLESADEAEDIIVRWAGE